MPLDPFHAPPPSDVGVPIVGQPATIHGWVAICHLTCNCEAKTPLMLMGFGAVVVCPACQRHLTLLALNHDARTNRGEISVADVPRAAVRIPTSEGGQ